ncbi:24255_t:CDS:2 [Gigaspora rosea]|nr:24255_t:CDS:2 [Gigaspora rosea]
MCDNKVAYGSLNSNFVYNKLEKSFCIFFKFSSDNLEIWSILFLTILLAFL